MLTPDLAQRAADVLKRARDHIISMETRSAGAGMQYHTADLHSAMFKITHELNQAAKQSQPEPTDQN